MDARAYVESHAREFIADLSSAGFPVAEVWASAPVSAYLWEELATAGSDLT
jgi:hypothetical protein